MRILYVVHQFYPKYVSGTEQYVLSLAKAARARGEDLRVFAVDPDFRDQEPPIGLWTYEHEGVPVTLYRFDKSAIRSHFYTDYHNPEVGAAFRDLLDEFQPEVVHFFHLRWVGVDRIDEVEARKIPFLIHLMDFWFVCPNFLLLRPEGEQCDGPPDHGLGCVDCIAPDLGKRLRAGSKLDRLRERAAKRDAPEHKAGDDAEALALMQRLPILTQALQRAACAFTPSKTMRDKIVAAGHSPLNLELAPYAIDWARLDGLPDLPASPITIGFIGTLAPHKGVDVLVRAFRELDDADARLAIHGRFGDFPVFDAHLEQLASGDPRIRFAGGFSRDELGATIGQLHCLVVPSIWRENTPFVVLEGRAAGIPVITSDLPGMTEANPNGTSFPAGDALALTSVLRSAVAEIRSRRGRRLDRDRSIPTIDYQLAGFVERYEQLLGER